MKKITKSDRDYISKCLICGNNNQKSILRNFDHVTDSPDLFNLVKCENCHLFFLSNPPNKKTISRYYPKEYEPYNIDTNFYVRLNNMLIQSNFKIVKNPIDHLFSALYVILYGPFPLRKNTNSKLLDIGCGNGQYLYSMKKAGWDVYGLDMSQESVNFANQRLGLKHVYCRDIETYAYTKSRFDVITLNHVIEHVYDPESLLIKINKSLRHDGTLIIITPNPNSVYFHIFGRDWFPLETPRHLTLFSPQAMSLLAKKTGYKIIKIKNDFSTHAVLKSIKYIIRLDLPLLKICLLPLTAIFAQLGRSDIATYHLKKND